MTENTDTQQVDVEQQRQLLLTRAQEKPLFEKLMAWLLTGDNTVTDVGLLYAACELEQKVLALAAPGGLYNCEPVIIASWPEIVDFYSSALDFFGCDQ